MAKSSVILVFALAALLAVGANSQTVLTYQLSLAAQTTNFASLETAAYIHACKSISLHNGEQYSITDTIARNGYNGPSAPQLVQYKIDCFKRLQDPALICNVDSLTPLATECSVKNDAGVTTVFLMDTVVFGCNSWTLGDTQRDGCPLDGAHATTYRDEVGYVANTNEQHCPVDYSVTGYNNCEAKAICSFKKEEALGTVASLMSFGNYCPGQADGVMCCGPSTEREVDANGYTVSYNTIDVYNNGAGLKPHVSHVVDLNVDIEYTISDPARLKAVIKVPYVTEHSNITVSAALGGYTYKMCPSTYMIDLKDPMEGRPSVGVMSAPTVRGDGFAAADWLPLWYLPKQDAMGKPRSTCSSYDFDLDEAGVNGVDLKDLMSFPGATNSRFYGSVPSFDSSAWGTVVLDESGSNLGALTPGEVIDGIATPFWTVKDPVGGIGEKTISYETGNWDIVRGWRNCKAVYDNADLVTNTAETEKHVVNGVAYDVNTYSWVWHICQIGRYGQDCSDNDGIVTYAKACVKHPASFSLSPQQIADVKVTPVDAATTAKVFLQSVIGSGNANTACSAGHERFVITLNLVFFELSTDSSIITDEAVHDIVAPSSMFTGSTRELNINVVDAENIVNVRDFLAARAEMGGNQITQGIFLLREQSREIAGSADPYRYQKVIIVSKCYNTMLDSTRGTRSNPNVFAETHASDDESSIMLETELVAQNDAETKRTALTLRILASKESFHLPSAEDMSASEVRAKQTIYGSYSQAKQNAGSNGGADFSTLGNQLKPGTQVCSKHQIDSTHAAVAHLSVNSVGACIINQDLPDEIKSNAGSEIHYTAFGMQEVQKYTYGCFDDWIDTTAATSVESCNPEKPSHKGCEPGRPVYIFEGTVRRVKDNMGPGESPLAGSYWFVTQGALNTRVVPGSNPPAALHDVFGAGLFHYDVDISEESNRYYYRVSNQMQLSATDRAIVGQTGADIGGLKDQSMIPGCDVTAGNLKSACNLVCFDTVRGLLTPTSGLSSLMVHHISVAEFGTTEETVDANTHLLSRRRRLLETVSFGGMPAVGNTTTPVGIALMLVEADPRDAQTNNTNDTTTPTVIVEVDDDDDNETVIMTIVIVVGVLGIMTAGVCIVCFCAQSKNQNKGKDIYDNSYYEEPNLPTERLLSRATRRPRTPM